MASFAEDMAQLRGILRANAVDKTVDEGMLLALLELYQADKQRIDLVLLDLEGMLGKELSVGAQQQRWKELQKKTTSDEITVEWSNIKKAPPLVVLENSKTPRPVANLDGPSTSTQHRVTLPAVQLKQSIISVSAQVNRFKRTREEAQKNTEQTPQLKISLTVPVGEPHQENRNNSLKLKRIAIRESHTSGASPGKDSEQIPKISVTVRVGEPREIRNNPPGVVGVPAQVTEPREEQQKNLKQAPPLEMIVPTARVGEQEIRNNPPGVTGVRAQFKKTIKETKEDIERISNATRMLDEQYPDNRNTPPGFITIPAQEPQKNPKEVPPLVSIFPATRVGERENRNTPPDVKRTTTSEAPGAPSKAQKYVDLRTAAQVGLKQNAISTPMKNPVASTSTAKTLPTSSLAKDTIPEQNIAQSGNMATNVTVSKSGALKNHRYILNDIPDINVLFASYVAAEFNVGVRKVAFKEYVAKTLMGTTIPRSNSLWNPPENTTPEHLELCQWIYKQFLDDQINFLVRALPDADPEFLEDEVKKVQGGQEEIRVFLTDMVEGTRIFPTRTEYLKRKEYNELANTFFTVEEFFEQYGDPIAHFRDDSRVTDQSYREEALNQLKSDFRFTSVASIRKVFHEQNYHYTPSFLQLQSDQFSNQLKTKRSAYDCLKIKTKDLFLIQEVAFIRLLPEIETKLMERKQKRLDMVATARANGTLLDCPICCEEELIHPDFIFCSNGHGVCRTCVRRQTEELIGLMKNHIPCLSPDCSVEYSINDLKGLLKKSIFQCFEKRRQAEEILAAGIEGLESCPFCDYCEVPGDGNIFQCKNPKCSRMSCRQCRELNHMPLRCEEHAMKQRLNNYVETKMTEALLRECPSCKRKFVKADGCNKMVCPCGTIMCYICRKKIKDYSHFSNIPPNGAAENPPNQSRASNPEKCPLYSDTAKMHEDEVAKSAARARAELASSNPNIRVDLVLGKK